jgi:hypothetical protein
MFGAAQLTESTGFQLPNSFAPHPHLSAHLVEGELVFTTYSETHAQH